MVNSMENRRGWIQIVEAFVAVLLVAGVLVIIASSGSTGKRDLSERIYETQISILREVQTDDSLRQEVAGASGPLPISWENFPANVKNKIIERTPDYLACVGRICSIEATCILDETQEKDVYSQSVSITATIGSGAVYRTLNLFCWVK
jgi:hypothetical protein